MQVVDQSLLLAIRAGDVADDSVISFAPLVPRNARFLILGSTPGAASIAAGQYYAHSRNAFWPIMACVTGIVANAPYAERCAALGRAGIALWDVVARCRRQGSLDSNIDEASIVLNDFDKLLATHPTIGRVLLNGASAAKWFKPVAQRFPHLTVIRLPSTSPANATWSFERKRDAWLAAFRDTSS